MMQQYRRIKREIPPDALLLFRLGDFYEMFYDDAKNGAQLLNLALTSRNGVPMCGIPHHAADAYIGRLLKHGRKVAICDQLEEARPGRLVNRAVTQILSPGAHFDAHILQATQHNYLAGLCPDAAQRTSGKGCSASGSARALFGLAFIDLTTGDFKLTELQSVDELVIELARHQPAEVVIPNEWRDEAQVLLAAQQAPGSRPFPLTPYDGWAFDYQTAYFTLRDHFKTQSLDGFGCADFTLGIGAAGAALHYLQQGLRRNTQHIHTLKVYSPRDFLVLDPTTQRNLEILESVRGERRASLLGCMDRTVTPMGSRLLREWLTQPLREAAPINARLDVVSHFHKNPHLLADLRETLKGVKDMERSLARLSVGSGNARDLLTLAESLRCLPELKDALESASRLSQPPLVSPGATALGTQPLGQPGAPELLARLTADITPLPKLCDLIFRAVVEGPPSTITEGNIIREGFNAELDELRKAAREGKEWIAALQQREIQRTGIASLKVRYNQVFGYYIEVTKPNLNKVPPDYQRKQTIAGGERFFTPELKEMESKILGAQERAAQLEYELFQQLRSAVLENSAVIQQTTSALAALDVLAGFAELARHHNYCRPVIVPQTSADGKESDGRIEIVDGRHPVLEQLLSEERFVPNDTLLDNVQNQILIVTGPNMAGKSTYIRQVALLVLMAQVGSFIPATRATISLVDRIFSRIGAADDLARGQSTFLVEMNETANILNNATPQSLVILDEIGRGTSTFDGLSIAWAVAEHIHNNVGCRTLFATHYHELTDLANTLPRVKNYNVAVREWNDQVIFLRKVVPGGADKSYGIHVARLAGLPRSVIDRAREILVNLEQSELSALHTDRQARPRKPRGGKRKPQVAEPLQFYLFGENAKETAYPVSRKRQSNCSGSLRKPSDAS